MKCVVLFGSPRRKGNTAALVDIFLNECAVLGIDTECIPLYEQNVAPCLGCMACQDSMDGPGCVQQDDFAQIFYLMTCCDVLVLATPIYAWYCTAPMKAVLDRAIYAGNKNYGKEKGPALLAGRRVATIATCGYKPEQGADLWESGLQRWCKHGRLDYLGMLCRRDLGHGAVFLNEEKRQAARDFALEISRLIKVERL